MNKDAMQEIDLLARLLINESLVKMDDIKDDDVPGLARAAIMQLLKQVAALRARAEQAEAERDALKWEKKNYGDMVLKFMEFCERHGLGKWGDNYSTAVLEYAEQLATVNEMQTKQIAALVAEVKDDN